MTESVSCKFRGGARIGLVNYTWPLASLSATDESLGITTTMFGLFQMGTYTFTRDQVVSIEEYGTIPFIGRGIRINHTVTDYPQKIVFWCSPSSVLKQLSAIGFLPAATAAPEGLGESARGVPFRWIPFLALIAIWNLLFTYEVMNHPDKPPTPGPAVLAALCLVFAVSIVSLRSTSLQRFFMKPGRSFGEIKPAVILIAVITGLMSVILTVHLIVNQL